MPYSRRDALKIAFAAAGLQLPRHLLAAQGKPPNFVLIFLDDSGWADFHPFGDPAYKTPNVQRLASQGCRFNNFYVPQAICSASRSALLSGCYPGHTKVVGAIGPGARGLDSKYETLGQVMKTAGYNTAVYGKWHIGDQPDTRPWARGFDESCGLMYSNDMWEYHPGKEAKYANLPLHFWENGKIKIERMTPKEQPMLTTWYTEHAVSFIQRRKNNPFFLYVPHSMPHVPIFASDKFKGKSGAGLYGDVIEEIDWSVGQIMKALRDNGVVDNTFVFFSSDNGPWITYGNWAGKTPYREAKFTTFDGGTRSACIVSYPGRIPAGTTSTRARCTIDMMPTLAHLAGAKLPDYPIDGKDVWDLISGKPGATNPHPYYAFSSGPRLQAVMTGDGHWKLHVPHKYNTLVKAGHDGTPGEYRTTEIGLALFDMVHDPDEKHNVLDNHTDITRKLLGYAEEQRREFYPDTPPFPHV